MMAATPQPARTQTLTVLTTALVLRLLVLLAILTHYPKNWLYTRGIEMPLLAKSLLAGHGLASPFGPPTGPTAFIAPGYPLFLALIFRLFGVETTFATAVILLIHTAANLLTVYLILILTRRLSGLTAAWVSGLFWAISLPLLWMPSILWDTCFSACILLGALALALRWQTRFTPLRATLAGTLCALAGLLNPALLPVLLTILLWLTLTSHLPLRILASRLTLAALAFAVVFSPWPIRNAHVFHAFIPTRTTVGFELWMGNRPGSNGFLDESIFPMYNQQELAAYKTQGELAYTSGKSALAKQYILTHPATFAALTTRRIARFWTGTGNQQGSALFALHACLTTLLGALGLWTLWQTRSIATTVLFTLPILIFPIPYYITHAEFRYRLVLDPILTVLAGIAVAHLTTSGFTILRGRSHRRTAGVPDERTYPQRSGGTRSAF